MSDIIFVVRSKVCFVTKEHLTAWIEQLPNGSQRLGLLHKANTSSDEIAGFPDTDWADDVGDKQLTSTHLFV